MDATIRRYEGTDTSRTAELSRKVGETLVPRLRELEGFRGYYAIEDGNGVLTSLGLFESASQANEATKLAESWVKGEGRGVRDNEVPPLAQDDVGARAPGPRDRGVGGRRRPRRAAPRASA